MKDLINRYYDNELSSEEKEELFKILNENEEAFYYFKELEILKHDLEEIKRRREKISLEDKILKKIKKDLRERKISLSLGFALSLVILILMFTPFKYMDNSSKFIIYNKTNHKYLISNIANSSNINEIELTLFVKDEKIEEKRGNLKIPKNEFNLLYETLNDKGDVVIEKIKGGDEKSDYILVKINYKNYPERGILYYLGIYLPYALIGIIFSLPLIYILRKKKRYLK
ncbi:MAG: hypothetical protein QMD25_00855 [Caldisericia bacterium]|nr:hypothetical protein [Caldisericia bacterium]